METAYLSPLPDAEPTIVRTESFADYTGCASPVYLVQKRAFWKHWICETVFVISQFLIFLWLIYIFSSWWVGSVQFGKMRSNRKEINSLRFMTGLAWVFDGLSWFFLFCTSSSTVCTISINSHEWFVCLNSSCRVLKIYPKAMKK